MHYATSPLCVACGSCNEAVGAINRPLQTPQELGNVPVRRFSMILFTGDHKGPLSTPLHPRPYAGKTNGGALLLSCLVILAMVLVACGGTSATHKVNKNASLTLLANASGDYPRNFNPSSTRLN